MSTAQDRYDGMLANHFAPWLKRHGFKRRNGTFRRQQDEAWEIVNFQRAKYSHARRLRFTINLGVSLDALHDDPPWSSRGWPLEHECDFRTRIGQLHGGEDRWWSVRPLFPTGRTVSDVLAALDKALPWLELYANPRALLAEARRDPSQVNAFGLPALVELSKTIGDDADVEAAQAEWRRWQRGERSAW